MVNFENLMATLSMKIRPFGPASDKPSDKPSDYRLQLSGKVTKNKQTGDKYRGPKFYIQVYF